MYEEFILDHYRNPRNFGVLKKVTHTALGYNPLCGDHINMQISLRSGTVRQIRFSGESCAICRASASLLTEYAKGRKSRELINLDREFMIKLLNISVSPMRVKCLMLPLEALKKALMKNNV